MSVTWYFDFISPFAYFQCEQLERLAADVEFEYRPILLAGVLDYWGHKGPAEIPSKRRFTYRQALWIARRDGIAFCAPPAHPFNPLSALRLAIALGNTPAAVRTIFRFIWAEGHRTDQDEVWTTLVDRLGVPDANRLIARDDVKNALRSNTDEAIALGVFGVPTIAVEKELFWGYDTTDMAVSYIKDSQAFEDSEMQRLSNLPIGVERGH